MIRWERVLEDSRKGYILISFSYGTEKTNLGGGGRGLGYTDDAAGSDGKANMKNLEVLREPYRPCSS